MSGGAPMPSPRPTIELTVTGTHRLTEATVEIRFQRPPGFAFVPGQRIQILHGSLRRERQRWSAPSDLLSSNSKD